MTWLQTDITYIEVASIGCTEPGLAKWVQGPIDLRLAVSSWSDGTLNSLSWLQMSYLFFYLKFLRQDCQTHISECLYVCHNLEAVFWNACYMDMKNLRLFKFSNCPTRCDCIQFRLLKFSNCPTRCDCIQFRLLKFSNFPTRCDIFNSLHFCRQLYMFRLLTPIIRSSYSCNYSFWHWSTGSTTIRSLCWG